MSDHYRIIAMFGYEVHGGKDSVIWQDPPYFFQTGGQSARMLEEAFEEWQETKRAFTKEEVVQGYWIKEGNHGHSFFTKLFPDGTLVEYPLGDPTNVWQGTWQLVDTVLRLSIHKYELDILANEDGQVHSGVEVIKGELFPETYFRCTHMI